MPDETPTPATAPAPKPVDPGTVLPSAQTGYGGATVSNTLPIMPEPPAKAQPDTNAKDEPCPDCPPADATPEVIVLGGEGLSDEFVQMFFSYRTDDEGAQKVGETLMAKRDKARNAAKETTQAAALRDLGLYVHPAPTPEATK